MKAGFQEFQLASRIVFKKESLEERWLSGVQESKITSMKECVKSFLKDDYHDGQLPSTAEGRGHFQKPIAASVA